MTDNSARVVSKRPFGLGMFLWFVMLAVVAAIVLLATGCPKRYLLDEEPPIVVKNGSMDIKLIGDHWVRDDAGNPTAWVPSKGQSKGNYHVKVVDPTFTANCYGWNGIAQDVNMIDVPYSDQFKVAINPRSSGGNDKTHVVPLKGLNPVPADPSILRYPAAGYIAGVSVHLPRGGKPLSCTFTEKSKPEITICSPNNASLCK